MVMTKCFENDSDFWKYNKLLQFKIIYSKYSLNNLVIQLIYKYVYKQKPILDLQPIINLSASANISIGCVTKEPSFPRRVKFSDSKYM